MTLGQQVPIISEGVSFISESFLELRVQPKTTPHQTLAAFLLAVGPPTKVHRYRDWNDNAAHLFTITKYSGVDPLAGINGIDNNIYPRARTFTAGVTVGF